MYAHATVNDDTYANVGSWVVTSFFKPLITVRVKINVARTLSVGPESLESKVPLAKNESSEPDLSNGSPCLEETKLGASVIEAVMICHSDRNSTVGKNRHMNREHWDCNVIGHFSSASKKRYKRIKLVTVSRVISCEMVEIKITLCECNVHRITFNITNFGVSSTCRECGEFTSEREKMLKGD
ncbi:hypothetical protein L1987_84692 [Smallanthus sonchifolius]|uniref:Uncharacterized protein n=1 Tax=Smallanthus sonchifolius TaxID=185202 RepID=A0ACB8XV34_9ASTR|nr:hypothetical protein L1987_84692 [Smallanthus sonchifolius]